MKKRVLMCAALAAMVGTSMGSVTKTYQVGGHTGITEGWNSGNDDPSNTFGDYTYEWPFGMDYLDDNGDVQALTFTITLHETNNIPMFFNKYNWTGGTSGHEGRLDDNEVIRVSVSCNHPELLESFSLTALTAYSVGTTEKIVWDDGSNTFFKTGIANTDVFDYGDTGLTPLTKDNMDTWSMLVYVDDSTEGFNSEVGLGGLRFEYTADVIAAPEPVTFNFNDGNGFDGLGVGGSETVGDITMTTVDIIGQDGSKASEGAGHTMYSDSLNCIGINDETETDNRGFNYGEAWVFSFNTNVTLDVIDFAGWSVAPGSEVTLSSEAFDDFVMDGDIGNDRYYPDVYIPAGTEVMMQMTWAYTNGDTQVRLDWMQATVALEMDYYGDWADDSSLTVDNDMLDADPDGDRMVNLVEYALGADPLVDDAAVYAPAPVVLADGGTNYLNMVYRRRLDADLRGLSYAVSMNGDLVTGSFSETPEEVGVGAISDEFESVTNRLPVVGATGFMRLEVMKAD